MTSPQTAPNNEVTPELLAGCAAEPIRIPGAIQPHGALFVLDPETLALRQASTNLAAVTGLEMMPGQLLQDTPHAGALCRCLRRWLGGRSGVLLRTELIGIELFDILAHATPQGVIVECEPVDAVPSEGPEVFYTYIRRFLDQLAAAPDLAAMARATVDEVRALTGFNRTLLYSFDRIGDGTVLAEDTDGVLPSYRGQRFPAADIPKQARELYVNNRLRLIVDAGYVPCPIEPMASPVDGRPLDLSYAALRSVSPVHVEYMQNMGTGSSMSISIVVEGELWGLISGHSRAPRRINAQTRNACGMIGQMLSLHIEARQKSVHAAERLELTRIETELVAALSDATSLPEGLAAHREDWLGVVRADGAAIVMDGVVKQAGRTPAVSDTLILAERLHPMDDGIYATDSLAGEWPDLARLTGEASGVLAIPLSQIRPDCILWFRPEQVRTVEWAGDPAKAIDDGTTRLHPRHSFAAWSEQVRDHARSWTRAEIESAISFRGAVQNVILRRAEEKAELSGRLERANKELEAFSYSISHDLRAPFRHIVGYAELLGERETALETTSQHYLASIKDSALAAGRLVDDLLAFSQLGRHQLQSGTVDMNKLAAEVRRSLEPDMAGRSIAWEIGALPTAWGDPSMIRQVLLNLLQNAVKYTATREQARISLDGTELADTVAYTVADNGVGFEMAYVRKLFGVFQRLHRAEEFEGSGIGLALVKRIVERHGGTVSAKGTPGVGAEFSFTLPKRQVSHGVPIIG
ncbi:ATP-binding protein [Ancylobacter sp. 6x-1]|uniref:histidine kinase n=1 Tax=Ancylobacter crimeensis TaxID=2579147 RepID=A0ABT0D8E3_9HYPH|nr:ATP-binding protein [Ancylobacter crimeensis]MCK0196228.1 ATP-binding protein [Ancylobacter crimeensis]